MIPLSAEAGPVVERGAAADQNPYLPPGLRVGLAESLRAAVAKAAQTLKNENIVHTEVDAFVLVNADGGANYAAAVDLARKELAALYAGRIDKHPTEAVTVYIFTDKDRYNRFCAEQSGVGKCPTNFGVYDRARQTIVMHATKGAETLAHELVHPLTRSDGGGDRLPIWFAEALGALYEAPVFCGPTDITGGKNWRYDQLRDALRSPSGDPPTLEGLFSMDRFAFLAIEPAHPEAGSTDLVKERLHYGTARYFSQWMDRQGKLWPFYRAWRASVGEDPDGRKTFAQVMGRTPADAQADWKAYVLGLDRPGTDAPCAPFAHRSAPDAGASSTDEASLADGR